MFVCFLFFSDFLYLTLSSQAAGCWTFCAVDGRALILLVHARLDSGGTTLFSISNFGSEYISLRFHGFPAALGDTTAFSIATRRKGRGVKPWA